MHRDRGQGQGGPGGGPDDGEGGNGCEPGSGGGQRFDSAQRKDHAEYTAELWERAFYDAMQELRVEAVKAKIKARFGKNLESTAAEVVDAMYADWERFQAREEEEAAERKKRETPDAREAIKELLKKNKKGPR